MARAESRTGRRRWSGSSTSGSRLPGTGSVRIVESSRPAVYRRSGELAAPAQTPTLAVRGQDLTDAAALRVVERSVRLDQHVERTRLQGGLDVCHQRLARGEYRRDGGVLLAEKVNGRGRGHAGRRLLSTAGMALGSGPQVAAFYRTILRHLSLAWARKWASGRLESEPPRRGAQEDQVAALRQSAAHEPVVLECR